MKPAVLDPKVLLSSLIPHIPDDTTSDKRFVEKYYPPSSKLQGLYKFIQIVYNNDLAAYGSNGNVRNAVSEWLDYEHPDSNEGTEYRFRDPSQSINANTKMLATPAILGLRLEYIQHGLWDVSEFLNKHPLLISILNEAYDHIQKYFPSSKVHLKISRDYDSTELFEELVAIIETDLSVKDTMIQLDEFDENWWDDNIDRAQDLLVIRV
ncbi:MAG: hypothetical protein HQ568_00730 [Calditrichaeota bacterium]|nr:hypothetical protein [Calditrichota bacterium]